MPPAYLFIHPVIGVAIIALIISAFAMKAGQNKMQTPHYVTGLSALLLMAVGVGVAFWAVNRRFAELPPGATLPSALSVHYPLALTAVVLMLTQAALGLAMVVDKRNIARLVNIHRFTARLTLSAALLALIAGVTLVVQLLQTLALEIAVVLVGAALLGIGVYALVRQIRQTLIYSGRMQRTHEDHEEVKLRTRTDPVHITVHPDEVGIISDTQRTLLQSTLEAGIAHTHVCGGNARCSTCRVVILDGLEHCQPRNAREQAMADRLHFDESIRLACQTRITGDVTMRRLVLDARDVRITSQLRRENGAVGLAGEEKTMAVLFSDIRGFTTFAETRPPFDVIHALNRYFEEMGRVINRHNGRINNYMGDGLLAIFDGEDERASALNAVRAGIAMLRALGQLQPYYEKVYNASFDIRVGIHIGPVVLGSLGAPDLMRESAIGDAVNLASRIEVANKQAGTRLLISEDTYRLVQDAITTGHEVSVPVKGKTGQYRLLEVVEANGSNGHSG